MPIRPALLAGFLVLAPLAAKAQTAAPVPERRQVTVTGTGEVSAPPDLAVATFVVQRNAKTAREALTQTNDAMTKVIGGMKETGIEARDLQTSGFSISPQYRYEDSSNGAQQPPVLVGYEVRNSLTARIRDVAKTGEILDKAVTLGANSGGDIAFDVENSDKLRTDARRAAVENAMANAQALAEAAGTKLGEVVRIDAMEAGMPPVPAPMMRMAMESAATKSAVPVEAGETTVHASVTMTFALAPAN